MEILHKDKLSNHTTIRLGGIAKKGDKFKLEKKHFKKIKAFIYGKDKLFFSKVFLNKIQYKISKNLNHALLQVFKDLKKNGGQKKILLFSPSAASFDQFSNFEKRGEYFNKIIKRHTILTIIDKR